MSAIRSVSACRTPLQVRQHSALQYRNGARQASTLPASIPQRRSTSEHATVLNTATSLDKRARYRLQHRGPDRAGPSRILSFQRNLTFQKKVLDAFGA